MDAIQRLLDERHETLMKRLDEIREVTDRTEAYVRAQNNRLGSAETKIAVLEERNPGRSGGIWGAVGGALAGFVASWMK